MGSSGLALSAGVAVGFAAGYVCAKGPEEAAESVKQLWDRLQAVLASKLSEIRGDAPKQQEAEQQQQETALTKSDSDAPFASPRMRSSDVEGIGAAADGEAACAGELSPTASLAGSVSASMSLPPTPLASGSTSFNRSSSGGRNSDRFKMVSRIEKYGT